MRTEYEPNGGAGAGIWTKYGQLLLVSMMSVADVRKKLRTLWR
jgi:hypothetical protein